jgi:DNA-binding NarL/FixJ family response regulator
MRVVIADDHRLVREGLRLMLSTESDVEVAGEAESGAALLELLERTETDVVLMDVAMPGMDGLEALARIGIVAPDVRVIMLTMHDDAALVRRAIESGAAGYLLKNSDRAELMRALHRVLAGDVYVQAEASGQLLKDMTSENEEGIVTLTTRELEVLQLVAEGFENKQVATELRISETTVKSHLANIFTKLDARSRTEAVANAFRLGHIE